jgi:TPR repeat protein
VYYYGKGVLIDYKKALSLFERAICGEVMAIKKLPSVYPQTDLHTDDTLDNLVFCTMSYRDVLGESLYYLGIMHKNGQGAPQDDERAQGYFREALDNNCKRA